MFNELSPILNQCKNLSLSITPSDNGEITVVMQSKLKPLDSDAPDGAKQLYSALAMPLVLKGSLEELDANFVNLLAEYCQQHQQSQSALEQSIDRIKDTNKAARQTAKSSDEKEAKTSASKAVDSPVEPIKVPAPPVASVTQQTNPTSLF